LLFLFWQPSHHFLFQVYLQAMILAFSFPLG
jgi:hypothetical protein